MFECVRTRYSRAISKRTSKLTFSPFAYQLAGIQDDVDAQITSLSLSLSRHEDAKSSNRAHSTILIELRDLCARWLWHKIQFSLDVSYSGEIP